MVGWTLYKQIMAGGQSKANFASDTYKGAP